MRVLLAEDSAVTREYLAYLLEEDPGLRVVGTARDGVEAVEQAERLRPDVIVMDVHMPRMNGYEATRLIMEQAPTPIVMVSASKSREEVAMTMEALQAGALAVLDKPAGLGHPDHDADARRVVEMVTLMAEVKVIRRWPRRRRHAGDGLVSPTERQKVRLIAIAASTGGPPVVAAILRGLPQQVATPLLLVQHIAPGFSEGLADWLDRETALDVRLAEDGDLARPGRVYVAPTGLQMGITRDGRLRLTTEEAEDGFRPSASYLFASMADAYGPAAAGVLLTGMGRDGAKGLKRLREAGGVTIVQDEKSSAVFGMPGEAIRLGAAGHILPPEEIAALIRRLATLEMTEAEA